jgi:cytochrome c-type biogenesis protein
MLLLILSFMAGILTVAAPCVLPLLPVIVGGSLIEDDEQTSHRKWSRPLVIACSLAASVVIFTLLLKATTALLGIPVMVWQIIAGGVVAVLGLQFIFPRWWENISGRFNFLGRSYVTLGKAEKRGGNSGDILIGAALGPVFSSCSPTYAFIVAVVLPTSFATGLSYLVAYAIGMSVTLLLVAYLGRAFANRLGWLSDSDGKFKKIIGVLFVAVGFSVMFGLDKKLQTFVLDAGWYDPISNLESRFRK